MQKKTRRRPAVILSIRIALSPGNPEALNILSPRPALILSTRAYIALNPQKNYTINWTFDRFGFWSSDDFKQSQLCGETFPKQSVTCKWHFFMRTTSMEIADMIFWIFGGGWRAPTFRRLMDSQVLSRKVCQNQPKDPPRNSPRLQRPDAWNILADVSDNTPSNAHVALDSDLTCRFLARLISFAAPRGAAEIQKALGTTSLSNEIKMRRYGSEHGTGID